MIQAALTKARRFFLGAGHAKRREPEAFALAAVLGPLEWFPRPEAAELLRHLLGLPEEIARACSLVFRFWPPRANGCEPDLIIDCVDSSAGTVRIIVEAKWYSKIEGEQLKSQWVNFGPPLKDVYHVILGADPTSVADACDQAYSLIAEASDDAGARKWRASVKSVHWREIVDRCSSLPPALRRSGIQVYARQVRQLLELQGARSFGGFQEFAHLRLGPMMPAEEAPWFWSGGRKDDGP
jgi:hypothetical protein